MARAARLDRERPWRVMNQRRRVVAGMYARFSMMRTGRVVGPRFIGLTEATRRHVRR